MFTYSDQQASVAQAARKIEEKASAFEVRVTGRASMQDISRQLMKQDCDFLVSSCGYSVRYDLSSNCTIASFSNVKYIENKYSMVFRVNGWNELAAAFDFAATARSPYTLYVITLSDAEMAALPKDGFDEIVTNRMQAQFDIFSGKSGYDRYNSQKRTYAFNWWRNSVLPNVFFCQLKSNQFENFGLRIGMDAEVCRLCHELFAGRGYSDREKVLAADAWVRRNITYVNSGDVSHSTAITLLSRKGVCQSIAGLMMAILQNENIPVTYVVGNEQRHAWNRVRVDGKWLNLDTTWGINYRGKDHPYLLREDDDFPQHTWDREEYAPQRCDVRWEEFCRKRSRSVLFRADSRMFEIEGIKLRCPGVVPSITHDDRMMLSLGCLFSFINVGYQRDGEWITIYKKERSYSFPISQEVDCEKGCQVLKMDGEYYIDVRALCSVPGFTAEQKPDGIRVSYHAA